MRRLPLELIERLRALRSTAETPKDHVGFVATAAGVYFLIASAIEVWRFLVADIILPVWRVLRPWLFVVALWLVGLGSAQAANDPETRCTELGTNCVCAETLNTNSYTATDWSVGGACTGANGCFWNPNNSTVKQCSHEDTNKPISTYSDYGGSNDATALAALPSGHSVSFFGARNSSSGIWWIGAENTTTALGATFNARMALRFYVYHGPDYTFRDDTTQCHSKFLQGKPGAWHWENFTGFIHMYDFVAANWGPGTAFPRDCCNGAPGADVVMSKTDWRGRWWFVEAVVTNRSGPGLRHILYMRDVTAGTKINGGVEFVAGDWYGTGAGIDPWTSGFNTVITSSPRALPITINGYREVPGLDYATGDPLPSHGNVAGCVGLRGYSHILYAGWDTDAGQRIGAATEVEGGTPPSRGFILRIAIPLLITLGVGVWRAHVRGV